MNTVKPINSLTLKNGVRIETNTRNDRLIGLGAVYVNEIQIRSNATSLRPEFSTPDGLHYQDFELIGVDESPECIVLHTLAIGRQQLYGEMMDEYTYNLAFPTLRNEQSDHLFWILKPCSLELDGERFEGFSLAFRFQSATAKIHRLTTVATWEIGGKAAGNTIYLQAYSCAPVTEITEDSHFSSACLKRLDLWDSWLGNSYQMLPRWGCIQPFDFIAGKEGVLLGYWDEPHSVKSLMQKNVSEDVIFTVDEYDFALTNSITTPAKTIVFSQAPEDRVRPKNEVVDLWTRAFEFTGDAIRSIFGITNCEPLPDGGPSYNGRNSCSRSELAAGPQPDWLWTVENGKFYYLLEGDKIESHDFLYWTADKILPRLHEQGARRTMVEVVLESDFTALCFANHAEVGWHGDLTCTSVCGTHRNVPAEFFGGWAGWNYMADKARKLDISLGHWVGLHLAPRAPIVQEHPEYILQHVNTLGHGGGYSHQYICSINWCSGAKQWFLDDLKRWHDEGGLEWLFFDSWPNLGCTALNYGGNMEPMQYEMGDLLHQLQEIGFKWFSFEGTSPFGVHRYGLWDPMQDYEKHTAQGVAGQNDFASWIGHEYMGFNQHLGPGINPLRDQSTLAPMSFRYMANKSLTLVNDPALRRTYTALLPLMRKRMMLPDDRGVLWIADGHPAALFSYKKFEYTLPSGARAYLVENGKESPIVLNSEVLVTQPMQSYRIG